MKINCQELTEVLTVALTDSPLDSNGFYITMVFQDHYTVNSDTNNSRHLLYFLNSYGDLIVK